MYQRQPSIDFSRSLDRAMAAVSQYYKRGNELTKLGYAGEISQAEYDEAISIERARVLLIVEAWRRHPEFPDEILGRQTEELLEILRL